MGAIASQITSLTIVCSTVYSGLDKKKRSKLCVTGHCAGNLPVTDEFPAQKGSNTENWNHSMASSCKKTPKNSTISSFFQRNVRACLFRSVHYFLNILNKTPLRHNSHSLMTWLSTRIICNIYVKCFLRNLNCFWHEVLWILENYSALNTSLRSQTFLTKYWIQIQCTVW